MSWFSDRIKKRKEINQAALEESFEELAGIKVIDDSNEREFRDNFICSQFAKYFKLNDFEAPATLKGTLNKIHYVIKSAGVIGRKITLDRGWNLENRDPILVFTKRTSTPILLLPTGQSDYYYVSCHTGKKTKITRNLVRVFQKEAYTFYKPLPSHSLSLEEYLKYMKKSIRAIDIVFVILLSVITTAIGMLIPYIMKRLTGEVVDNQDFKLFGIISAYIIGAGFCYVLIKATQGFVNSRVAIRIEKTMQETTMKRMLSLPVSFFKKYSTGELTTRFNSVGAVSTTIFNGVFLTLLSSVMSLAFVVQIVQFAKVLLLPVIIILLATTILSMVVGIVSVNVSKRQVLLSAKENGTSYAIISGIQKIRLAGAEKRAFAKWAKSYALSSELLYRPPLIIRLSTVLSLIIALLGNIVIYFIAAKNNLDISSYVAFTTSFSSLSLASSYLTDMVLVLAKIKPVMDLARPILEEEEEDNSDKEEVESLDGNIRIENLSFKYNGTERMILNNINLDIKEGEYIGIVGKTGCGKSTLVRLLLGFEKPSSGAIYFDGKDMKNLNLQSLRTKIGTVTQNGGVFHADILSNILITAPNLKEEDAWEAAKIAGISEDIKAMPMGMNTVISEGQGGISGGQKQRIMIARAIVNKPKVLIFDEATSALDNKTQKNISSSISELKCTRIVIAHRLSTIKDCDRIIYMEDGAIKEQGTYQELMARKEKFYELVERQKVE